jgi:hypothetical protein
VKLMGDRIPERRRSRMWMERGLEDGKMKWDTG